MKPEAVSNGADGSIRVFPGFPLPAADYKELVDIVAAGNVLSHPIVIAHSRGALEALHPDAHPLPPETTMFLLAPSVPKRRWGTRGLRGALLLASVIPLVSGSLGRGLRRATYRRYGALMPSGEALDLRAVARRLRSHSAAVEPRTTGRVVVMMSDQDARYDDQIVLARRLGATVIHQAGDHLFPITHAASTAAKVLSAVNSPSHPPHSARDEWPRSGL